MPARIDKGAFVAPTNADSESESCLLMQIPPTARSRTGTSGVYRENTVLEEKDERDLVVCGKGGSNKTERHFRVCALDNDRNLQVRTLLLSIFPSCIIASLGSRFRLPNNQ